VHADATSNRDTQMAEREARKGVPAVLEGVNGALE
jgi:hypothetical protein